MHALLLCVPEQHRLHESLAAIIWKKKTFTEPPKILPPCGETAALKATTRRFASPHLHESGASESSPASADRCGQLLDFFSFGLGGRGRSLPKPPVAIITFSKLLSSACLCADTSGVG